jgi:hypothetical protein
MRLRIKEQQANSEELACPELTFSAGALPALVLNVQRVTFTLMSGHCGFVVELHAHAGQPGALSLRATA